MTNANRMAPHATTLAAEAGLALTDEETACCDSAYCRGNRADGAFNGGTMHA